jgi:hypothetical protein
VAGRHPQGNHMPKYIAIGTKVVKSEDVHVIMTLKTIAAAKSMAHRLNVLAGVYDAVKS